jgi:hypothetical protein
LRRNSGELAMNHAAAKQGNQRIRLRLLKTGMMRGAEGAGPQLGRRIDLDSLPGVRSIFSFVKIDNLQSERISNRYASAHRNGPNSQYARWNVL